MSPTDAVKTCFRKYVDFSGRARRSEYWWWTLFSTVAQLVIVAVGLALIFSALAAAGTTSTDGSPSTGALGALGVVAIVLFVVAGLFSLATLLPGLAVTVRRLHDGDHSGWWILLSLVPVGGFVLLVLEIMDGTPGPNRFGPSPKGAAPYGGPAGSLDQGYGHPVQA